MIFRQALSLACLFIRSTRYLVIASSLGLLVLSTSVQAQAWEQLSDTQKEVLTPLEEDWNSLSKDRQKKWVAIANRYPEMSESEQNTLQSRMSEWASLSQDERRVARDNYLLTAKVPAEKKAEAWKAYQQLSEEDKKRLAEKKAARTKPSAVTAPTLK